jgi:hypothetical protein
MVNTQVESNSNKGASIYQTTAQDHQEGAHAAYIQHW